MLGHAGVHEHSGSDLMQTVGLRIHQHGDLVCGQYIQHILQLRQPGSDALDCMLAVVDSLGKGDGPAHGQRARQFRHHHREAAVV